MKQRLGQGLIMKILVLESTVWLAFLAHLGNCSTKDKRIVGVPSPNNFILYENSFSENFSGPFKIQSDIPVSIHRFDYNEYFQEYPVNEGEGMILVTSTCDTADIAKAAVPQVKVRNGLQGATTITTVDVELGIPPQDASLMPFLRSSSYDATWSHPNDFMISPPPAPDIIRTACMTEADCDEIRQQKGMSAFRAGQYATKGCFEKNGKAYWGLGGSEDDKGAADLPGVQECIWCEKKGGSPLEKACRTREACDQKRLNMGIAKFSAGDFPIKGCFAKNDKAYWGNDGSVSEMSRSDLPGIQERIWCDQSAQCETGPNAIAACNGRKKFCQLKTGVCNEDSVLHAGVCEDMPESCIELFLPVCGCDGKTYGNECKARLRGVNVSRRGKCLEGPEEEEEAACLTEDECDRQRRKIGIGTFQSGAYPTKGCFSKNDKAYFSSGTAAEMSKTDLPGVQERIWCTKKRSSATISAIQQESTNTLPQEQDGSATSSASSFRPFVLSSLIFNAISTRADETASYRQSRILGSCTYNVEILLHGCDGAFGDSTSIKVDAPKARVINPVLKNRNEETFKVNGEDHIRNSVTLTYPENEATVFDVSVNDYVNAPTTDDDRCARAVPGRPFADSNGESLLASSFPARECSSSLSWSGSPTAFGNASESTKIQASSTGDTTSQSDLGGEWTRSALGEHASVASFAAFSIALMTNHAPRDLVEDSLNAAMDEVQHAKISFDIASKLLGKDTGPGPLPPSSLEFNYDLAALAISVAKEGCIDETLSALAAAAEVELIGEALVNGAAQGSKYSGLSSEVLVWIRDKLRTIAMDESNHSALAWRTLSWVCTANEHACGEAKSRVLNENKLIKAFQQRFGRVLGGNPELFDQTMAAWTRILANQKVIHPDISSGQAEGFSRFDEGAEEEKAGDLPDETLLFLLAENVSRGGTYRSV